MKQLCLWFILLLPLVSKGQEFLTDSVVNKRWGLGFTKEQVNKMTQSWLGWELCEERVLDRHRRVLHYNNTQRKETQAFLFYNGELVQREYAFKRNSMQIGDWERKVLPLLEIQKKNMWFDKSNQAKVQRFLNGACVIYRVTYLLL